MSNYNDYDVRDFWINFPCYKGNAIFLPVIRYTHDGENICQRILMSPGDWSELFRMEGIDPTALAFDPREGVHFSKTVLVYRESQAFFGSSEPFTVDGICEDDNEEYEDSIDMEAHWFTVKK